MRLGSSCGKEALAALGRSDDADFSKRCVGASMGWSAVRSTTPPPGSVVSVNVEHFLPRTGGRAQLSAMATYISYPGDTE